MRDIIRVPEDYTTTSIKNAFELFTARRDRLRALERAYYTGQVGDDRDYVVNNCKTIADTKSAYLAGIPPTYTAPETDAKAQTILDLFKLQVKPQLDQELTAYCSRFGMAFEVAYLEQTFTEDGQMTVAPKSVALSPLEGFVAYDETLDPDSVFGAIHYVEVDDQRVEHHYLDVYDKHEQVRFVLNSDYGGSWTEVPGTRRPHGFDRVPVTEFRNNPDMIGDFEPILPLQRALNEVLNDRVKDKNKFADALLLFQGVALGDTDEEIDENMGRLKDQKTLAIPRDASASFLTKTFDEASVQILVDYINGQMHKVSGIPDMTDENFAANASGVAIKYKLMALNNLAQSFISQFNRGFLRRCKLYSYALFGPDGAQCEDIRITFRFNLPNDNSYDAQTMQIYLSNGTLSRKTMMENCPYIDDVEEEQRRLDDEAQADDERDRMMMEDQRQTGLEQMAREQGILDEEEEAPDEDEDDE